MSEEILPFGPVATLRTSRELLDRARAVGTTAASVVVDCGELRQCDAAGLQVLLALRSALAARGGLFRIVNVPADLRWRFDYTGLPYTAA
ncbi:MAG: STAS domain-containing protein [Gemmatimonadetes bacterium]|nr:STAS domain-containing protein [Gemmatimonadota bacterium]